MHDFSCSTERRGRIRATCAACCIREEGHETLMGQLALALLAFFTLAESGTRPALAAPASCATLATDPPQGLNGAPGIKSAHH